MSFTLFSRQTVITVCVIGHIRRSFTPEQTEARSSARTLNEQPAAAYSLSPWPQLSQSLQTLSRSKF